MSRVTGQWRWLHRTRIIKLLPPPHNLHFFFPLFADLPFEHGWTFPFCLLSVEIKPRHGPQDEAMPSRAAGRGPHVRKMGAFFSFFVLGEISANQGAGLNCLRDFFLCRLSF